MAGDVRYCTNCRRNIAVANYVIHSAHCERKIQLCDSCNEPVPRTEMSKHMEEYHTLDACEMCGDEMEKFQMSDHRDSCFKRPVPCKFCSLETPMNEAEEHENVCGTRTEMCATCKNYVKLIDQDTHKATCLRERHARPLSVCEYCNEKMPASLLHWHAPLCGSKTENCLQCYEPVTLKDRIRHVCQERSGRSFSVCEYCHEKMPTSLLPEHSSLCGSITEICSQCYEPVALKDKNRHGCKDVCIPCEYCDTSIPSDHFVEHLSICGFQLKNCLKCNASYKLNEKDSHTCQSPPKTVGRCSVCHAAVPWMDLREHEAGCRLAAYSSSEDEEEKPKFSAIPTYQKRQSNYRQTESRPHKGTQETKTILKMKQCPYCKERYPDLIVEEHSKDCNQRPFTCEYCRKSVLLKDKLCHEKKDCQMKHSTSYNYSGDEKYSGASGYTKEYEKRLKQCPYCQKKFPEIMFVDHQAACAERPYQCSLCLKMMPWRKRDNHESKECIHFDRFQKVLPGSEDTSSKDVPVYKRSFQTDYLEKNSQVCPYCKNRIPEAKLADHVQCCTQGKKLCHFCGAQICFDEERLHLQNCVARIEEDSGFQTAGGKKGKKKNKKGKHQDPDQPKGFISTAINFFSGKSTRHEKEFLPDTYFGSQLVQLPCEFCDVLFPEYLLIEHQSGCRPDLVSLPNAPDARPYASDRRVSPDKDKVRVASNDGRYPRNTGALPKRNIFLRDDAEVKPGEFLSHQSPPNEGRDYFNYPSGVPDYKMEPDVVNQGKTTFKTPVKTPDSKTTGEKMDKKVPARNSATQLFNFSSSSSSNSSSSNQSKSPPSIFSYPNDRSSPTKQRFSDRQKTELKAVGAERAERKGIVRISRDTVLNCEDESAETLDEYDSNFQVSKDSRNSDKMSNNKMNQYSSKLTYSGRELNIPFDDESSVIDQYENLEESNCDARLAKLLNEADPSDITEDDAKNDETFGSNFDPREPLSLSNEEENLSDSVEQFYDAEDDLKMSNMKSLEKGNLDAYVKLLTKDEDEMMIASNNNNRSHSPVKDKVVNCECGNRICLCGIISRTPNNNYLDTESEGHQGNSDNIVESSMLPACSNANRPNCFNSKELYEESNNENQMISAEIKKRSPKFTEYRSTNMYSDDSD